MNKKITDISIIARAPERLTRIVALAAMVLLVLARSNGLTASPSKKSSPLSHEADSKKRITSVHNGTKAEKLQALQEIKKQGQVVDAAELRALRDNERDPLIRYRLNERLADQKTPAIEIDFISTLLNDSDALVRQGAAQNLGNYVQNSVVVAALAKSLMNDKEPSVCYAAALSLSLSNTPMALNALEKASLSSDSNLRRQVAFSLKRHKSKKAQKILEKLAKDSDPSVRAMAKVMP